eukprot:3773633-Pleurochrysis_carterae.AAC.1
MNNCLPGFNTLKCPPCTALHTREPSQCLGIFPLESVTALRRRQHKAPKCGQSRILGFECFCVWQFFHLKAVFPLEKTMVMQKALPRLNSIPPTYRLLKCAFVSARSCALLNLTQKCARACSYCMALARTDAVARGYEHSNTHALHAHAQLRVHVVTCMQLNVCKCPHTRTHTRTSTYARTRTNTHTRTHRYGRTHIHARPHTSARTHAHAPADASQRLRRRVARAGCRVRRSPSRAEALSPGASPSPRRRSRHHPQSRRTDVREPLHERLRTL